MKDNKLIAEFMDLKSTGLSIYKESDYKYHKSWDWLMPVIDKIENFIFDENNSYNVTIGSTNYCVIQDSNGDTIEIIKDNGNSKLDTTYQAVVEFIKQNNKNKYFRLDKFEKEIEEIERIEKDNN